MISTYLKNTCFMVAVFGILLFSGCGGGVTELPINRLKEDLADKETYSILLDDMKEEGFFSKRYYHKYRVVEPDNGWTTNWLEVPEEYYVKNDNFLGMTLASKKDGDVDDTVGPPGYAYVGDPNYGQWKQDSSGNSFWEFYGKYALISHLFGGFYRPIYRNDYNGYRQSRSQGRTYYGSSNQYGSSGSIAKKNRPNFYSRRMGKAASAKKSFSSSVGKRIGRTKTSYRGRAGGFGK